MTTSETIAFIKLVSEMRNAQEMFRSAKMSYRKKGYFIRSNELERQVDAMLKNEIVEKEKKLW